MKLGRAAAIRWMFFMGSRGYTNRQSRYELYLEAVTAPRIWKRILCQNRAHNFEGWSRKASEEDDSNCPV